MQADLEVQTFRFWCTARSVRHGYVYGTDNKIYLTPQAKLEEIDYQLNTFTFKPTLLKKFKELREELTGNKANEFNQPAKTAS